MAHRKKILVICPYPFNVAPSQRLKFEQYYKHFRSAGYELHISPFISPAFWKIIYKKGNFIKKVFYTIEGYLRRVKDLFRTGRYDLIYIHLWVTPFGPPFFERLLKMRAKKTIYDIDDLIYLSDVKSRVHPLVNFIKGRNKPLYLMQNADHVITCTPYLDQFVRKFNPKTTDISSTIDTNVYKPKSDYCSKKKFIIGWSGSHSTSKYLHLLDNVFRNLAKHFDYTLLVMGDSDFKIQGVNVEALPWKEEYEVEVISRFDIGVYPLPDEQWVYGKSGLKALQYMALGIPTVATAVGTIFRIIQDGENGFLVNSEKEWELRISELIRKQQLREKIGKEAAITVEEQYSINANKATYISLIHELTRNAS